MWSTFIVNIFYIFKGHYTFQYSNIGSNPVWATKNNIKKMWDSKKIGNTLGKLAAIVILATVIVGIIIGLLI